MGWPDSLHSRRTPNSGGHITPDRLTRSRSSSTASTVSKSGRNSIKTAAQSFAGAFTACFIRTTDVNTPKTKSIADSDDFSRSGEKDADSLRRRRSSGTTNRSIYTGSNNSTHRRESGCSQFTMEEINRATGNFSPTMKIGEGGFGTVYKARLEDGMIVAVKRAKKDYRGKHLGLEFQSEIKILKQVEHMNLVKFHGFVDHEDEKIVVVEYVPNGTLREHLDCIRGDVLDLAARLDVAIDVAHAVTYLHMYTDNPIIHRDIKSSNILLTENFRAKVADFGFARVGADGSLGITHVSTQVKGTAGYLDPEYLKTYQLTDKSDVYSFGVLLVELLTGRRPIVLKSELKERVTTRWAVKKFMEGDALSTLDPLLEKTAANNLALEKIFELASRCLNPNRHKRPSMRRCAEILWRIRKDYTALSVANIHHLRNN